MKRTGRLFGRRSRGANSPALESAARAKRARDHLSRKRERERVRLERARHREEIRRGRLRIVGVLTPVLCLGAAVLGMRVASPLMERFVLRDMPLEAVTVQGTRVLSPQAVAAGAGALAGVSLGAIDPQSVGRQLAREPWIESARALRLPGGTLVLSIVEREAVARFTASDETGVELVDPTGARFAGAVGPGGALPLIRGDAERLGALPNDALEILRALREHAPLGSDPSALTLHLPGPPNPSAETSARPSGYVLELGEAGPRALLGRRLFSQRVARLAALLEEDEAMVESARLIDLRYADRLVLQTAPASG